MCVLVWIVKAGLKSCILYSYSCRHIFLFYRSMELVYERPGVSQGVPVYRFVAPKTLFANGSDYPPNEGFCPCRQSGLLDVRTCRDSECPCTDTKLCIKICLHGHLKKKKECLTPPRRACVPFSSAFLQRWSCSSADCQWTSSQPAWPSALYRHTSSKNK